MIDDWGNQREIRCIQCNRLYNGSQFKSAVCSRKCTADRHKALVKQYEENQSEIDFLYRKTMESIYHK